MNLVQVVTLIARVRQDANLEGAGGVIPDSEIMDRLNRAKGEFIDEMRTSGGTGYFEKTTPVTQTISMVDLYPLPKDLVSVQYVLAYTTSTSYIRCKPFTPDMLPMFSTIFGPGWVVGEPIYYRLTDSGVNGDVIQFRPFPTAAYQFQVGYQYAPPDFVISPTDNVTPTGSIDDRDGWSDFMVARAAQACCRKLKLFDLAASFQQEAAVQLDRIKRMAPLRDMGSAEVQRDVKMMSPGNVWPDFQE
jgi:hypothetical protein